MNEALLEKIKSRMYWRINIRPASIAENSLIESKQIVQNASISLRGWDYPHIHRRENDQTGADNNGNNFVENWCDWSNHLELWRIYQSSQFIHYLALREAWKDSDEFSNSGAINGESPEKYVSVVGSLWTLTEIFEFSFSMYNEGLYQDGCNIEISLRNCAGAELYIDDFSRVGFSYPRETSAESLDFAISLSSVDLKNANPELSLNVAKDFFDKFGWESPIDLLKNDQQRLLTKSF